MDIPINVTGEIQFIEACLKTVRGFKGITIHNICNGEVSFVPYGGLDIATVLLMLLASISFTVWVIKLDD